LGWGHFSTVWLCTDLRSREYLALKVVKSDETYTESANDEIKILKAIRDADPDDPHRDKIVQLLDVFKVSGIHGTHMVMVLEVVGANLLKLITGSKYRGIPLSNVKSIVRQVLESLDYLHTKSRIIHTDIKPENILIKEDSEYVKFLHLETEHWDKWKLSYPKSAVCNLPEKLIRKTSSSDTKDMSKMTRNQRKKYKQKLKKKESMKKLGEDEEDMECETEGAAGDGNDTNDNNNVDNVADCDRKREEERPRAPVTSNPCKEECDLEIKLADLGNACWVNKQFTQDIQTRQYRSLEVIIGAG
jgi:serine/threonine-protein kinase SRPK1